MAAGSIPRRRRLRQSYQLRSPVRFANPCASH